MSVVPSKKSKRVVKKSAKREVEEFKEQLPELLNDVVDIGDDSEKVTKKKRVKKVKECLINTDNITFPETEADELPEFVYPDELPSQPDFQPVENEPQPLPVDESACCPSAVFESVVEDVAPVLEDIAIRVLSECKTKVWNAVTKRWIKLDGKKAKQLGL